MLRFRIIFVILCGLLITAASIVIRYHAGQAVPDQRRHIVVKALDKAESPDAELSSIQPAVVNDEHPQSERPDLSDEVVRRLAAGLSSNPMLASWLVNDDLLRRFVQSVNLVAGGYSPRDELGFLAPAQPFVVARSENGLTISPGCYRRYDLIAEVFVSIDVDGVARLYDRLGPAMRETHREVSWYAPEFDEQLAAAIDHLLETPIPEGPIEVERHSLFYAFADADLERLSPAQRQLLRMGPRNVRLIQNKLRVFRRRLALPGAVPVQVARTQPSAPIDSPTNAAAVEDFTGLPMHSAMLALP